MTRGRRTKQQESAMGRRNPKHQPTKHLHAAIFIDWPHCGPRPGRPLREFVKIARRRETREAWRVERVAH